MHKNEFFDYIITLIDRSKHPVEYKNPDLTILLEISNDLLCFTVVRKYYEYRSYNLLALCKSDEELRLEKEKLMYLQNTAHERKHKNENISNNIVNELLNDKNEILKDNNLSLNEEDDDDNNKDTRNDMDGDSDVDLI